MTVLSGGLFLFEVETAPNVWTECADLSRVTKTNNANISRTRVFRKTYRARGTSDRVLTLAGLLNYADPGQYALILAERNNTPIRVRWAERGDETDMTMQTVRVATVTHEGTPDPGELQTITYELRGVGDPTHVSIVPSTPAGLFSRFNQLGASASSAQMLALYAYGVNQTIVASGSGTLPSPGTASPTGYFCTKWDDAINPNQGKHWRPSADLWGGNGAPCSASGIIQGAGLELPNSTGLTGGALFHSDPNVKTDTAIPNSGNLRNILGDKTAGMGVGGFAKFKDGIAHLLWGETGDLNKVETAFGDDFGNSAGTRNSATFWSAGAQAAGGTPALHFFMHLNRTSEPEAAGTWENWSMRQYGRDIFIPVPAPANSLAAGRRLRLGSTYGSGTTGAARSVFALWITAGRYSAAQNALVNDYGNAQYLTYDDARRIGYLLGDSEFVNRVDINMQLNVTEGSDGAVAINNFGLMWCGLSGSRPQLMINPFVQYIRQLDFSKRPDAGVAILMSEWINATPINETLTDAIAQNYYVADLLRAIAPAKVRLAMHNETFASIFNNQQSLNDPAIDNDLKANAVPTHADFLLEYLRNTSAYNTDSHIYNGGDPNRDTPVWEGIHRYSILQRIHMINRVRIAMKALLGIDITNLTAEVLATVAGVPVVTLTAGAPTATLVCTPKSNSNATLSGKTYTFTMWKHVAGQSGINDTVLDNTIATVNAAGVVTRVAAGTAICQVAANDGGLGFCIVVCT